MRVLLVASEEVVGEDWKLLLIAFIQCYYRLSRRLTALQ